MSADLAALAFAAAPLAVWIHLLTGRGGYWRARERDDRDAPPEPADWPAVTIVTPARNEADVIERSVSSLLAQDYPGPLSVILVDDSSEDETAARAEAQAAGAAAAGRRFTVLRGAPLAPGWTGKLWAVSQGVRAARAGSPRYILLTDADIAHAPSNLRSLVARAEAEGRVLVSLMARLSCANSAERLLIPAFVYFFDMLYPFARVNSPASPVAAAAGGCMLVRADALERAGGVEAIRGEIIDDCALARRLKAEGPIWLGLTERAVSLRPYRSVAEIGRMVSRSAYAELKYSPLRLAGAIAGLFVTFLEAPIAAVAAPGGLRWLGLAAFALMALSFQPMLRLYRRSPLWGFALPAIAALYAAFTVRSALDQWSGQGGQWKGRIQAEGARP